MLHDEEHALWVALAAVPDIGRSTIRYLFDTLPKHELNITQFWVSSWLVVRAFDVSRKQYESMQKFKREQNIYEFEKALKKDGIRVALFCDSDTYPPLLLHIDDAPASLYIRCAHDELPWQTSAHTAAVIGSRNMTEYGERVTQKLVGELVNLGIQTVSGCMYGIDAVAHQATIDGGGITVGVLGYGFDYCYPLSVRELQEHILASGGALLTEYAPFVSPKKGQFAQRNRLISGLSEAVIIVEAAARSGTLITAQCALDQGRAVCAVPGPITSPHSEGTAWLVNQGATLVLRGSDVLDQLPMPPTTNTQQQVLAALVSAPATLDELISRLWAMGGQTATITSASLNQALTELEINGSIMRNVNRYELSHC